jgi:hypothetical protein
MHSYRFMKVRLFLFPMFACLLLCGCPTFSVHPLCTNQDAIWIPSPDEKGSFVFQKSGDHWYGWVVFYWDTKVTQNYELHLVRLAGQHFMDLIFKDQTVNGTTVDDSLGTGCTHVIAKVKISADDPAYATLEDDAIRNQSTSPGTPLDCQIADGAMPLTTQTEGIRRYISAPASDALSDFELLHRKSGNADPRNTVIGPAGGKGNAK